jgi:hypothetical protein
MDIFGVKVFSDQSVSLLVEYNLASAYRQEQLLQVEQFAEPKKVLCQIKSLAQVQNRKTHDGWPFQRNFELTPLKPAQLEAQVYKNFKSLHNFKNNDDHVVFSYFHFVQEQVYLSSI